MSVGKMSTFPVLSAWLIHVHMQVYKTWGKHSMTIIVDGFKLSVQSCCFMFQRVESILVVQAGRQLKHFGNGPIFD